MLKPLVGRIDQGAVASPAATPPASFALAAVCVVLLADPARRRVPGARRLLPVLVALLLAGAVAAAMVAIGSHT